MRVLSNTTYMIDSSLENMWLFWMKETFMPLIEQTNLCELVRLYRLQKLEADHDETFALHLEFKSRDKLALYNESFKMQLDTLMIKKFGSSFAAFRTILDEI